MSQQSENGKPTILVVQIIAGALMSGVTFFALVVFFVIRPEVSDGISLFSFLAIGFFAITLVISFVLSQSADKTRDNRMAGIESDLSQDEKTELLMPTFQTKTIMTLAPLEGAGMFACVAFMISGEYACCGVLVAALVVMAFSFPTQGKFDSWANIRGRDSKGQNSNDQNDENSRDF